MYGLAPSRHSFVARTRTKCIYSGRFSSYTSARDRSPAIAPHQSDKEDPRSQYEEKDWRAQTRYKRLDLGRDKVDLGVNTFGEPSRIRIFQDKPRPEKIVVKSDKNAGESTGLGSSGRRDVIHALAAEKDAASAITAEAHLEEIRAKFFESHGSGLVTLEQYASLAQELRDGFTKVQLQDYLSTIGRTKYDDLERPYRSEYVVRAEWVSGKSEFPAIASKRVSKDYRIGHKALKLDKHRAAALFNEDLSDMPAHASFGGKVLTIDHIIRKHWGIREASDKQQGELDFLVRPGHFHLLLNNRDNILQRLSEQYNVRIEMSAPLRIIRISGEYDLTSDVYKLIYRNLKSIMTAELYLTDLFVDLTSASEFRKKEILDFLLASSYLRQVERLTGTRLTRVKTDPGSSMTLNVLYYGPTSTDLDDVRRIISQTVVSRDPKSSQVKCDLLMNGALPIEVPIESSKTLPLGEKFTKWVRWGQPLKSGKSENSPVGAGSPALAEQLSSSPRTLSDEASQYLLGIWKGGHTQRADARVGGDWEADEQYLSATLGCIAHPGSDGTMLPKKRYGVKALRGWLSALEKAKAKGSFRALIPDVPGLLKALASLATSEPTTSDEFHILLRPQKLLNPEKAALGQFLSLPTLELILKIDHQAKTVKPQSARLVYLWRSSDLLIPAQAADVCFYARSSLLSTSKFEPSILEFLQQSNLDIWGSKERLKTPSRLTLNIAEDDFKRMVAPPPSSDPSGSAKSEIVQSPKEDDSSSSSSFQSTPQVLEVEYLFSSLELMSSMHLHFRGFPLRYTTIEAGQTGGRRSELVFETTNLLAADDAEAVRREKDGEGKEGEGGKSGDGQGRLRAERFWEFWSAAREVVQRIKP